MLNDVNQIKNHITDCIKSTETIYTVDDPNLVEINKLLEENAKKIQQINAEIKKLDRSKLDKEVEIEQLVAKNHELVQKLEKNKAETTLIIKMGQRTLQIMGNE